MAEPPLEPVSAGEPVAGERGPAEPAAPSRPCRDRADLLARMKRVDPTLATRYRQQEGQ